MKVDELRAVLRQRPYVRVTGTVEFQNFQTVHQLVNSMLQAAAQQGQQGSNAAQQALVSTLINLIVPDRLHFAVQPFDEHEDLIMYSNLKRECYWTETPTM